MAGSRVGVMGGTFNPPHVGHLICAQEALVQLGLDSVLWMPVHAPPHKQVVDDPGPELRAHLCELAVAGDARFSVSRLEVERDGPSWSVDTLRLLQAERPDQQLTFIMGGDQAHGLPTWKEPAELLRLASLGVAERSGIRRADVEERLVDLHPGDRLRFFAMPRVDVSSSLVRRLVAEGRSVRYLVPDAVAAEIEARGLYRGGVGEAVA